MRNPRLKIAINAQVRSGTDAGGVETVLAELTALGHLDGPEEYTFIGAWDEPDWLQPLLNAKQRIVRGPRPNGSESFKRALGPLRPIARKLKGFPRLMTQVKANIPTSDGFYEGLQCQVVHFPFQSFVKCKLPTIYNPHDLQHLHYPEFFERSERKRRETVSRQACKAADTVVVASQFVKQDIVRAYDLGPDRVQVIHWAAPPAAMTPSATSSIFTLEEKYGWMGRPFALYPAMTWEHKNHLRLLDAIAYLRDHKELRVNLVCTGHRTEFWPHIERRLRERNLQTQVKFTGMVSYDELRVLYGAAQFVIIPTLFEAASAPLFEGWQHHLPVACSSVTSLPEQAADAALLFNPFSVAAVAAALEQMTIDKNLRNHLRQRGDVRLQQFSLEKTSKSYRAVYRRAAGQVLNEEDRWLLNHSDLPGKEREREVVGL